MQQKKTWKRWEVVSKQCTDISGTEACLTLIYAQRQLSPAAFHQDIYERVLSCWWVSYTLSILISNKLMNLQSSVYLVSPPFQRDSKQWMSGEEPNWCHLNNYFCYTIARHDNWGTNKEFLFQRAHIPRAQFCKNSSKSNSLGFFRK